MIDRRSFLATAPWLAAAAGAQTSSPSAGSGELVYLKPAPLIPWNGQIGFSLDPLVSEWQPEGRQDTDRLAYTGGGYRLELDFHRLEPQLLTFQFRLQRDDKRPFTVRSYSVRTQLSFVGIYRIWDYRSGPIELMDQFNVYTRGLPSGKEYAQVYGANSGIPIVLCSDREGRNRFTFGMLDQVEATGLRIGDWSLGLSPRGEGLNFWFEFVKPAGYPITRTTLEDGGWLDTRLASWFDTIGRYTHWVETTARIQVLKPPVPADEPIWKTSDPYGQNINEDIIWKNAALCRKAGITMLSLDAGYNNALTAGMDTPEHIESFNDNTGDWIADRTKFPDFRALVKRLHEQGHVVTVWVALFIVGKATRAYQQVRQMLMRDASGKELIDLCPCHPDTPGYLARTFLKLATDYDLDGLWLDFMDGLHIPCHASHPHSTSSPGEGYNRCLAAVRDALIQWKPSFLIETRMKMANINVKQFVNVLETSDMPFDFDLNRSLGVFVRSFGEGLAAKLDPAQWHIHESNENVAKSCATVTLTGVPVFGVDFTLLPESHLRVVAAWMRFYRQHQKDLSQGQWTPVGFAGLFPQFRVSSGVKEFVYIASSSTAPTSIEGREEVYVVNAADTDRISVTLDAAPRGRWRAVVRNCFLEQTGTHEINVSGDKLFLDEAIPQGGLLELHKI